MLSPPLDRLAGRLAGRCWLVGCPALGGAQHSSCARRRGSHRDCSYGAHVGRPGKASRTSSRLERWLKRHATAGWPLQGRQRQWQRPELACLVCSASLYPFIPQQPAGSLAAMGFECSRHSRPGVWRPSTSLGRRRHVLPKHTRGDIASRLGECATRLVRRRPIGFSRGRGSQLWRHTSLAVGIVCHHAFQCPLAITSSLAAAWPFT